MQQIIDTNNTLNVNDTLKNNYNYQYFNNTTAINNEIIVSKTIDNNSHCIIKGDIRQKIFRNTYNMSMEWILILLLLLLFSFAWIKTVSEKYLNQIVNSIVNYQVALKLFRNTTVILRKISVVFNIIYVFVLSLFLFEIIKCNNIIITLINTEYIFPVIVMSVGLLFVLRILILRLFAFIFNQQKEFEECIFSIFLFNKALGILLFSFVAIIPFAPNIIVNPLIIIGIVLIILMNVLKLVREIKIILSKDFLIFYLILYFCTLEIIPVALMYKFIASYIH